MGIFDRNRWQRLQPLLDQALDLSSEQRVPWLVALWKNDPDLADELILLLAGEVEADDSGFLSDTQDGLTFGPARAVDQ
jgi:hypothetical protein